MKRLGFHTLRDKATDTLGDKLSRQLQEDVAPKMSDEEAFSFAEFNAEDAERGGYSDYSYWKSTLRAFFQNKIAVFFREVFSISQTAMPSIAKTLAEKLIA